MPTTTNKTSSTPTQTSIARVGAYLANTRRERGHTQQEVADALGRSVQWVSDVEHGRRGSRMDPVLALLWSEFLNIDAQSVLDSIGLVGERQELARVRHYLETGKWAHKWLAGHKKLGELGKKIAIIRANTGPGDKFARVPREDLNELKSLVKSCLQLLRIPRTFDPPTDPESKVC